MTWLVCTTGVDVTRAVSYLQEGFNYNAGTLGTNSPWTSPTNLISVTNTNLSYPYLMDFSPPAKTVAVSEGNRSVTYRPLSAQATNGCVYFSFLINFTTIPGNYYIAGLTQSTNIPPGGAADDPLDLIDGISGAGCTLGVRAMDGASSYITNGSSYLSTNTTYFVVMKFNFTNGAASLYVNPPAGNTEPSVPDASSTANVVATNLAYVYLRVGSSSAGDFMISALRVASTWAEVTPATNAATAYSQAAMLSSLLDSLQVNEYWLEGTNVNWLTGVAGPYSSGPNMTIGTESHCSAFAGAVTYLAGVYLLRQPQASDLDLANYQAEWLATNTMGWTLAPSMTAAQHLANTGALVVASYLNPDFQDSGHIAILRPSNRTDCSVNQFGPEECQSGEYNYVDTNVATGFSEHPGSFPTNILYYSHGVSYPLGPSVPYFNQSYIDGNTFFAAINSLVGRSYRVQWSTNLTAWTTLLSFTNSNKSTNFYTNTLIQDAVGGSRFYRVAGP